MLRIVTDSREQEPFPFASYDTAHLLYERYEFEKQRIAATAVDANDYMEKVMQLAKELGI